MKKFLAVLFAVSVSVSGFPEEPGVPRIVRDEDPDWALVPVAEAPQIVRICRKDSSIFQRGTGTVVSASCALTAAHVIQDADLGLPTLPNLVVYVAGTQRAALRYLPHPGYSRSNFANDLCLLWLDMDGIPPVPQVSEPPALGSVAAITGFGYVGDRKASENFVPEGFVARGKMILDFMDLAEIGGTLRQGYSITAAGDSGSPLLIFDAAEKVHRQAGVLSHGYGSDLPDWRNVKTSHFVRTDLYRDWIAQGISDLENDVFPKVASTLLGGKFALNWFSTTRNSLDVRIYSPEFLFLDDISATALEVYVGGEYYDGCDTSYFGSGKFFGNYGGIFAVNSRKGEIRYTVKGPAASDLPEYLGPLGIDKTSGNFLVPVSFRISAPRFREYSAQGAFAYRTARSGGKGKF